MSWSIPSRFRETTRQPAESQALRPVLHRLGVYFGFWSTNEPALSWAELRRSYHREPAFTRFLPIMDWDAQSRLFIRTDLTWAAILELVPIDAEARNTHQLERMLLSMVAAFACLPERDQDPWIIQFYLQDEPLMDIAEQVQQYPCANGAPHDRFHAVFVALLRAHLTDIARPGGVFEDPHTGVAWGGRRRRCRLVLYRNCSSRSASAEVSDRKAEVDSLAQKLERGLAAAGVRSRRIAPGDYSNWMIPWLNPAPDGHDNAWSWLARFGESAEKTFPPPYDLHRAVLLHCPRSDPQSGFWWLNQLPHRYLPILGFRSEPRPGLLTLEKTLGRGLGAAFFDQLPEGTVFNQTIIFSPQDRIAEHLDFIERRSKAATAESQLVREDIGYCQAAMARGHALHPATMGFYLRGQNPTDLRQRLDHVTALCRDEGLEPVEDTGDVFPLDAWVRYLPAAYHPQFDRVLRRERLTWDMNIHAAGPLFGKATGSGRPGWMFFDRSGQPLMIDPLHTSDRDRAPHCLIVGPTGTGKSALLNWLCLQALAMHRPRLYIVDVGDSFRLMGDWLRALGLQVQHLRLDRSADVRLPPFAASSRMLYEQIEAVDGEQAVGNEDYQVDFLAEMEAAAQMIITGGEHLEEQAYSRQVRTYIRSALVDAALDARQRGQEHATISDFSKVLGEYAQTRVPWGCQVPMEGPIRERMNQLSDNARFFRDGVRGRLFDRLGEPWPDVDVTILDFGRLAQGADKRDILELAFVGFMNAVQRQAEQRRGSGRQSIVVIDEGHITTTNPVLAEYLVKGSKMWRKWGLWLWLATQSLKDFPPAAKQILSMAEFWMCLSMSRDEVDDVAQFRSLTQEERQLMESTRKAPGRYSEGVLLSTRPPMLFRSVPPALALALAQTEEGEVAERHQLMAAEGLTTELEAVEIMAERIRTERLQ